MEQDIKEILVTQAQIETRTKELAHELMQDYQDKRPILIGLLKGSVPFMAELLKHLDIYAQTEFMVVSSYHGTVSTGEIHILKDLDVSIKDRHLVIVEDIVDTGLTLNTIMDLLMHRGAASVEVVCLLDKPSGRKIPVRVKYLGFTVPNEFVVGFGLDYNEYYRNLPYIGVLKEEVYSRR